MARLSINERIKRIVDKVFGNFGFKVLAIFIAILIWVAIISGREAERIVEVPLNISAVSTDIIIEDYSPKTLSVKIAGKGRDLILANKSDFSIKIDLSEIEVKSDINTIIVTTGEVSYSGTLPINVDEILGDGEIEVQIEKNTVLSVPIVVSYEGLPADGYFLGMPHLQPERTTIFGPESVVTKIDALRVEIAVEGRSTSISAERQLTPPLPGITIVGPDNVLIALDVTGGTKKSYKKVPISVRRGSERLSRSVEPEFVNVVLEGHPERLAAFRRPNVYINTEDTPDADGNYKVYVGAGSQIRVISVSPIYVSLLPQ